MNIHQADTSRILVGVSACLLGAEVRFDGGHKRNDFIDDLLVDYFHFVPFCPEVAIGLGIPREPIRLVQQEGEVRAVGSRNANLDVTDALRAYGRNTALEQAGLCGFIFKRSSPSCGMERVKVYTNDGMPARQGTGLFADEIMRANDLLPVEEEGRLHDPVLRENFITRVYVLSRWRALEHGGMSKKSLLDFHASHKYLLLAHNPAGYREIGRMLSGMNRLPLQELASQYIHSLMHCLRQRASRKRHMNVLQHLMGYLRDHLDASDRQELANSIASYGEGFVPLIAPMQLLRHHFRRNPHPYIRQQVYLEPYPEKMMLRNTI